jgi:hypothetical protein
VQSHKYQNGALIAIFIFLIYKISWTLIATLEKLINLIEEKKIQIEYRVIATN